MPARAQRADVPIEPRRVGVNNPAVLEKLKPLRESGKLMTVESIRAGLAHPSPRDVRLPAAGRDRLSGPQIAQRTRKAMLRVGWVYLCQSCHNWHLYISNGYALTEDGLACTCFHVLKNEPSNMREGYLFAMNVDGEVYPVTAILAADSVLDVALFQIEGSGIMPLPLNDQTAPGESVYICSDPSEYAAYFSEGIINRFYWESPEGPNDPNTLKGARHLRIDVSTDWSPGSSGAAVVDECGNAVGHVSSINAELDQRRPATNPTTAEATTRPAYQRATYIILHQAIPARGVRLLVESMNRPQGTAATEPPENKKARVE
jgi:hypothetical protein